MTDYEKFYTKTWKQGSSLVITIPKQLQDYTGIQKGDLLKVMIKKVIK